MEDLELKNACARLLAQEKQDNGKKFSTYYEGYGRIVDLLEQLHQTLDLFNQALRVLWNQARAATSQDEIYHTVGECLALMSYATRVSAMLHVLLAKLQDGVVHPIKIKEDN